MLTKFNKAFISIEQETPQCHTFDLGFGSVAICTMCSPSKTTVNEDAAIILPFGQHCVLAIADGAGGMRGGAQASSIAVNILNKEIQQAELNHRGFRDVILDAIEQANQDILALGIGAGSTISVVEINRDIVRNYHAGDSMTLIVGQRGKIKYQSISHSPVGYAETFGYLNEVDALAHEDRHLISNMLGLQNMYISVGSSVSLDTYDTLLVSSDGVFDNVYLKEIIELIRKDSLEMSARSLLDKVIDRMNLACNNMPCKPDDVSFILYRPGESA